jgi:hypothetical protein
LLTTKKNTNPLSSKDVKNVLIRRNLSMEKQRRKMSSLRNLQKGGNPRLRRKKKKINLIKRVEKVFKLLLKSIDRL